MDPGGPIGLPGPGSRTVAASWGDIGLKLDGHSRREFLGRRRLTDFKGKLQPPISRNVVVREGGLAGAALQTRL